MLISSGYFYASWSVPYLILLVLTLNFLYQVDLIDPRNKAYGLNYDNRNERPSYTREGLLALCTKEQMEADRQNLSPAQNWEIDDGRVLEQLASFVPGAILQDLHSHSVRFAFCNFSVGSADRGTTSS